MRRILLATVLSLLIVPLLGLHGEADGTAEAGGFSEADIDGPYGFSFDGFITDLGVIGGGHPIPITAVGQFDAKRATLLRLRRTINVGGVAIVEDEFVGEARVDPDGRGVASFCSTKRTITGNFAFPDQTFETFSFVITGKKNEEIEFIGTGLFPVTGRCPENLADPIAATVLGIARKQAKGRGGKNDND